MYKSHTQKCVLVLLLSSATLLLETSLLAQEAIILSEDPIVLETARKTVSDYGIEPTAKVSDGANQKICVLNMNGKQMREINIGMSFCDIGFITE